MGIVFRVIVNLISLFNPLLLICTFTSVPFSPLNLFTTPLFSIPIPATFTLSTVIIRSPEMIPSFSDGPPVIGDTTTIVSSIMLNSIPIPLKPPSIFSLTD